MVRKKTKNLKFKGGDKLNKVFKQSLKNSADSVEVGFFQSAKYQDGTPVAYVAAINQFGSPTQNIPQRAFFTDASKKVKPFLTQYLKSAIDPKNMDVTDNIADKAGLIFASQVQDSITDLTNPGNAQSTIDKKGSSNPLIDTGFMRQSVTYKVNK